MENTKYKLDETDTIDYDGVKLYRIIALRDIGDMVKKGDRGGYVENEKNLSAFRDSWVGDEAKVYGEAIVFADAQVFGRACVGGAKVSGDAMIYGDVQVDGDVAINNDTEIFSNTAITDKEHERATHDLHEAMERVPLIGELSTTELLSTTDLLNELKSRGGLPAALAEAALLHIRKGEDYNHKASISAYFPFGTVSYAQMLHTKALRFVSLTQKELEGEKPNYEGLRDTALDIINYAGFYISSVTLD